MGIVNIDLNVDDILKMGALPAALQQAVKKAAAQLAAATHAKAIELAGTKLNVRRKPFIDALSFKQVNEDTWLINLDRKARWIEDGMCVVYGSSPKTVPSVTTPDGPRKITAIKPGDLVLNQYNKWVKVLAVHDNDLLDFCREEEAPEETFDVFGYFPHDIPDRSHKGIVVECVKCGESRQVTKNDWNGRGRKFCPKCAAQRRMVRIEILLPGHKRNNLVLTEEHRIMTERGWIEAGNVLPTDKVMVPHWGKCLFCGEKTSFGRDFCNGSCVASFSNNKRLREGTHPCQNPEWMKNVFKAQIAKGGRISKAENLFAERLSNMGYTVGFSPDFDWERQRAVPKGVDKLGRQTYYFLDFFNAKLKLCLEIDGTAFHCKERDDIRDAFLRNLGIQVVHIPAQTAYKPFLMGKTLEALLGNHEEDIELRPYPIHSVSLFSASLYSGLTRRWDITVDSGESFVCQGMLIHNSNHEMIDNLLKNPKAKQAADGSKYLAVPFKHNKGATQSTVAEQDLTSTVKSFLRNHNKKNPDNKIGYGSIERNPDGRPKLGLLHQFSINTGYNKTHEGPGQGKGPIGAVKQGPTGIPFLQGIRIYQREVTDKQGKKSVERNIMTFRMVSSKHRGTGRWRHPGLEPAHLFDEAAEWAQQEWAKIKDSLMAEAIKST